MKKNFFLLCISFLLCSCDVSNKNLKPLPDYTVEGSTVITYIKKNNVTVYENTRITSKKMYKLNYCDKVFVNNIIKNEKNIAGSKGNWMDITFINDKGKYCGGYVKSKYVKFDEDFEPSEIKVLEYLQNQKNSVEELRIEVKRKTKLKEDIITTVLPHKEPDQNFYTFRWNNDERQPEFFCTDLYGTFLWYPETNEIKHVSYTGYESESAWTIVSDDLNYLFDDGGTSTGSRALNVFNLRTGKLIFRGTHIGSIKMKNDEITVAELICDGSKIKENVDEETANAAEKFIEENNINLQNYEIYAFYRYNYVKNVKTLIEFCKGTKQ